KTSTRRPARASRVAATRPLWPAPATTASQLEVVPVAIGATIRSRLPPTKSDPGGRPVEPVVNHQLRLAARPVGLPKPSDWEFTEEQVTGSGEGDVVVRVDYLSLDPAMRGWMSDAR